MLKKTLATISMMVCMAFFAATAWGLDLKDGKYEITTRVEIPGMPMQAPPMTITQCLTQQDPLPNQSSGGQPCKIIEMNTDGNAATWKMECTQQGQKMKSTGKIVYQGNSFKGTTNTTMGAQSGNMTITTVISGKRIGDCQ